TVMVKEAVSPGWITSEKPGVTALVISRCGSRVTLADAWAVMMLLKLPRFCARVKATVAVLIRGAGSPAWMAPVSVKVQTALWARLDTVAVLLALAAWMASASRFPSRVSVKKLLGLFVSSTRLGLSAELVLVTVYV